MTVVVPVDDDFASTHPGNEQSHMESRNRGRVLLLLETIAREWFRLFTWMMIHSAAGAVYIIVTNTVQNCKTTLQGIETMKLKLPHDSHSGRGSRG